jgi:hypothetical protein
MYLAKIPKTVFSPAAKVNAFVKDYGIPGASKALALKGR